MAFTYIAINVNFAGTSNQTQRYDWRIIFNAYTVNIQIKLTYTCQTLNIFLPMYLWGDSCYVYKHNSLCSGARYGSKWQLEWSCILQNLPLLGLQRCVAHCVESLRSHSVPCVLSCPHKKLKGCLLQLRHSPAWARV